MPIIVRFTNSPQLLWRAQLAALRHMKWMRWTRVLIVGVFLPFMIAMQLVQGRTLQSAIVINLPWLIGFPALWFLGIPLGQRWDASRIFRGTPAAQGERVYTFDIAEITVAGALSSGVLRWQAIVRVVETREFFLLFLSKRVAHYVPKSAFASEAELSAFRKLAADKIPSH